MKKTLGNHWLLLPIFITTVFGFGYQAIPLFSWCYIPTILLYTRYQHIRNILVVYFVSSISLALCFLGNFRVTADGPLFPGVFEIFFASLGVHLILVVALLSERYTLCHQSCIRVRVLLFPSLWTGLWFLFTRMSFIGDYPTMSTALISWPDFAQAAALGGRPLLDFLVALFGTSILEIGSLPLQSLSSNAQLLSTGNIEAEEDDDEEDVLDRASPVRKRQLIALLTHPMSVLIFVMAAILTYGGARVHIRAGSFYQASYPKYIPKTEQVGCVVGPGSDYQYLQFDHDIWFNKSKSLAESGAKLIIWSELTAAVNTSDGERALLKRAREFALDNSVYLGITYAAAEPVGKNMLVVIDKQGKVIIDYNKAHPVPGVELQPAGPAVLQYADTEEFGRIGGGICFDYNFPHFISQASTKKVDLMLQPSWTWGPIGTYHGQTNLIRAVENGFTLFRCVSQGVSGVFEPTINGLFNQKVASLNVEQYMFSLPLQKRVPTLYGYIGDSFSYVCLLVSICILGSALYNSKKRARQGQVQL